MSVLKLRKYKLNQQKQPSCEVCHDWKCIISRLLFADNFVLLYSSITSDLQRALNSFPIAGIKINTAKTKILHLQRNPHQYSLQMNGVTLKQIEKHLGVEFTRDGRHDSKLSTRTGKNASLVHSVVLTRKLSKTQSSLNFQNGFCPRSHLYSRNLRND